jgi:hypothetical protein
MSGVRMYEIGGREQTLPAWCEEFDQNIGTIRYRLRIGMDLLSALRKRGGGRCKVKNSEASKAILPKVSGPLYTKWVNAFEGMHDNSPRYF